MALNRVENGRIGMDALAQPPLTVPIFCHTWSIRGWSLNHMHLFNVSSRAVRLGSRIWLGSFDIGPIREHAATEWGFERETARPNMLGNGREIQRAICDAQSG